MKLFSVVLFLWAASFSRSHNHHFNDCDDNDCYYYDFDKDPRNDFLNLIENVEDTANNTFSLPDWQLIFSFTDGSFYYDYDGGDYTCICPLQTKNDQVLATYHEYLISSYRYKWFLPKTNLSGGLEVAAEMFYNINLVNRTNHLPKIERINSTYFHVFSWWFEGLPLEWLERIPNKVFEKIVTFPLKPFIEKKLDAAYEEAIYNIFHGQGSKQGRRRKSHSGRPTYMSKFRRTLKPHRPHLSYDSAYAEKLLRKYKESYA